MLKRGVLIGGLALGTGAYISCKVLRNMHAQNTGLAGGIHYTLKEMNLCLFNAVAHCADKFDDFMEDWAEVVYGECDEDLDCCCEMKASNSAAQEATDGCGCTATSEV